MPWDGPAVAAKLAGQGKRSVPVFCDQSAAYKLRKGQAVGWANKAVIAEKRDEVARRKRIAQLLHRSRCVDNAAAGRKLLDELEAAQVAPKNGEEDIWTDVDRLHVAFGLCEDRRALEAAIATLRRALSSDDFQVYYHAQSEYASKQRVKYGRDVQRQVMRDSNKALAAKNAWKARETTRANQLDEALRSRARRVSSYKRQAQAAAWTAAAVDASTTNATAQRDERTLLAGNMMEAQPWDHSSAMLTSKASVASTRTNLASFDLIKDATATDEGFVLASRGGRSAGAPVLRRIGKGRTGPKPRDGHSTRDLGLTRGDLEEPPPPAMGLAFAQPLSATERKHHRKAADWYYD